MEAKVDVLSAIGEVMLRVSVVQEDACEIIDGRVVAVFAEDGDVQLSCGNLGKVASVG